MSSSNFLTDARLLHFEEGVDYSNNCHRTPSHSTFGEMALGPLSDDFFSDDQKESFFTSSHLAPTFSGHQDIINKKEGDENSFLDEY